MTSVLPRFFTVALSMTLLFGLTSAQAHSYRSETTTIRHSESRDWHSGYSDRHFDRYDSHRYERSHHSRDWLWGTVAAGAVIYGLASLARDTAPAAPAYSVTPQVTLPAQPVYIAPQPVYVQPQTVYVQPQTVYLPGAAVATVPAVPAVPAKTVYWCEAEQGYYPQVRACPTGWTPLTGH